MNTLQKFTLEELDLLLKANSILKTAISDPNMRDNMEKLTGIPVGKQSVILDLENSTNQALDARLNVIHNL
jgi:hypothetical protein